MIPPSFEDAKKEAFRLFGEGQYRESLAVCNRLNESVPEPAVAVLTATNLYYTGNLDEAEACFRDLARKMPDSSYVHSYLAKILEDRDDDGAIAEYTTAVRLDPANPDALRSYGRYLAARGDFTGAVPVLEQLAAVGKNEEDRLLLARAYAGNGQYPEAIRSAGELGRELREDPRYPEVLYLARDYYRAAESARALYDRTHDAAFLRLYLKALSRHDAAAARETYAFCSEAGDDPELREDYIRFLCRERDYSGALAEVRRRDISPAPARCRLAECRLLAAEGELQQAAAAYEALIRDELPAANDPALLERILGHYRSFLLKNYPAGTAAGRFIAAVSGDASVITLLEIARLYEGTGALTDARAGYYRAYRSDFLNGGLRYAGFLSCQGEDRECEKVMIYILSQAKKNQDLCRIAAAVTNPSGRMHRFGRLRQLLVQRLEERRATLGSAERELLAVLYLTAAEAALNGADVSACKYACLCGMDVIPVRTTTVRLEDFSRLLAACKERAIADRPVMQEPPRKKDDVQGLPEQEHYEHLGLDDQEQKILAFVRSHRSATERDLRQLLGTRRVAGIVNRLIRKAAAGGVQLLEKKGAGEDGEVYEYTGT